MNIDLEKRFFSESDTRAVLENYLENTIISF